MRRHAQWQRRVARESFERDSAARISGVESLGYVGARDGSQPWRPGGREPPGASSRSTAPEASHAEAERFQVWLRQPVPDDRRTRVQWAAFP